MNNLKNHIDQILNIFNTKIFFYKEGLFSGVICNIVIDKIFINGTKNCYINIINNCINNGVLSERLFLESIYEYSKSVSSSEKLEIAEFFGVKDLSNFSLIPTGILSQCQALAYTSNTILIKEVIIGKCSYSKRIDFNFINTGSSNVTCLMNKIFNKLQPVFNPIEQFEMFSFCDYIYYGIILIFIYILFKCLLFKSKKFKKQVVLF